jgi:hypothetical protein
VSLTSVDLDPTLPNLATTSIQITTLARIDVLAPAQVSNGQLFPFTVRLVDTLGQVIRGHGGLVQFSSSDALAVLPPPTELPEGVVELGARVLAEGQQTLTATEGAIRGSATIQVVRITEIGGLSATGSGPIQARLTGGGPYCHFSSASFLPLAELPRPPGALVFPHGLFEFTLQNCTPGSTITMTVTYPNALPDTSKYWKYGPRPGPIAAGWYELTSAQRAGNIYTFTITDGQAGDDDLVANGTIVDQGGPGNPAEAIPVGSTAGCLALAFLCALAAVLALRR